MTGSIRPGNENEPIALESCFGWVVSGYYESSFLTTTNSFKNLLLNTSFYDTDHMKNDDSITSEQCQSNESREFISQFKNNLMMRNNCYKVNFRLTII